MDIEVYAARLEAEAAQRDYSEAYEEFQDAVLANKPTYGSSLDYAVWSTAGYADSALRAEVYAQQEANERKTVEAKKAEAAKRRALSPASYIRMTDGVKGKRTPPRRLVVGRRFK